MESAGASSDPKRVARRSDALASAMAMSGDTNFSGALAGLIKSRELDLEYGMLISRMMLDIPGTLHSCWMADPPEPVVAITTLQLFRVYRR